MANATAAFGGQAGRPYPDSATGVLIGKTPDQLGINALQIEFFEPAEKSILELMAGVSQVTLMLSNCYHLPPVHSSEAAFMRLGHELTAALRCPYDFNLLLDIATPTHTYT